MSNHPPLLLSGALWWGLYCLKHYHSALSCQEALLSRGCQPARHMGPLTYLRANSSPGFQRCELHLGVQDCQHLDPRAGVARSSPGMHCISSASSCFHSGLTFIFTCGSLLEENMLILSSSWVHFTCNASSCARTVWSIKRKGGLCAALFLRRWPNVRVKVSKLSQSMQFFPSIFYFLIVLQKGAFQNSRVWGKYIWSLTSLQPFL